MATGSCSIPSFHKILRRVTSPGIFFATARPTPLPRPPGNAYRRSVLTRIFPLPTDAQDRHGADFFCIYGSTLFGSVAACEQVLGLYRVHRSLKQTTGLSFGNVGSGLAQDQRLQARLKRFRQWISERTGGHIMAPSVLLDFSIENLPLPRPHSLPRRGGKARSAPHSACPNCSRPCGCAAR